MGNSLIAVIDLGSTALRLLIAEIDPDGNWKVIDRAEKPVSLGGDVFVNGKISKESLIRALRVLAGFKELLEGWGISESDVKVIATSAVREAHNRDTFIDRVEVRTGFSVEIIEGIDENRLTFMAVQYAMRELQPEISRSNSLIIEVGGGSTEVMLLQRGKMAAAHSLNIGTVRIEQQLKSMARSYSVERFLEEQTHTTLEVLDAELQLRRIRYFIAVGGHARLAAQNVKKKTNEWYWILEKNEFDAFVNSVKYMNTDECVRELNISYDEAEGLTTSLIIYQQFMKNTSSTSLIIPNVSIREGLLLNIALGPDKLVSGRFDSQVIASAISLGKKFHFDEEHALHVTNLALTLFDELTSIHNLNSHSRLLLNVAGILHDIGTYIRFSGHHKHGQYIVENSEIFGLPRGDLRIVSNVVRYHRKAMPIPSHMNYISLSRENRIRVLKMSAILRVADALDRGHNQRIKGISVDLQEDEVILHCDCQGESSSEKLALSIKADLFEEVFGMDVILL